MRPIRKIVINIAFIVVFPIVAVSSALLIPILMIAVEEPVILDRLIIYHTLWREATRRRNALLEHVYPALSTASVGPDAMHAVAY